jgi:hypothetical protein
VKFVNGVKVKVVEIPYGKRKGFYVKAKREFLYGPATKEQAQQVVYEYMV